MHTAPCVFHGDRIIAVCYVDDLFVFSVTNKKIEQLREKLRGVLSMKDLGIPKFFFGTEFSWKKDAVHLRQKRLIKRLLDDNNMREYKPMITPMNSNSDMRKGEVNTLNEK